MMPYLETLTGMGIAKILINKNPFFVVLILKIDKK